MKKRLISLVALLLPVMMMANHASGLSEEHYYYLRNVWFGHYAASSGDAVVPMNRAEAAPFLWQVVKNEDGTVNLINKATGTAAYVAAAEADQAVKLGQEYGWKLEERTIDGKTGICIIDESGENGWYTNPNSWKYILLKPFWGANTWEFQKSNFKVGDDSDEEETVYDTSLLERYYTITHAATGYVLNNRDNANNDAYIYADPMGDTSEESRTWRMRRKIVEGNWYQLYNPYAEKALDMALEGLKRPLQWNSDFTNTNQQVSIVLKDEERGLYQLTCQNKSGVIYTLVVSGNETSMSTNPTAENSYFTLTEVFPTNVPLAKYWEDETTFEEYKEVAHATYMPYPSTEAMRADERYDLPWLDTKSERFLSLNGVWKLNYVENTDDRP